MKKVLYVLVALVSFSAALAGALAFTGNLSRESLMRLIKQQPAMTAQQEPEKELLSPLAQEMKEREAALKAREQAVAEREAQVAQREKELEALRKDVEQIQKQIQGAFADEEQDRQVRLETIANTVAEMKADRAAQALEGMPVDEAAEILAIVEAKDRGKIVEKMDPEFATRVLSELQNLKL